MDETKRYFLLEDGIGFFHSPWQGTPRRFLNIFFPDRFSDYPQIRDFSDQKNEGK
jgi:hypothetical protein